jgi:hypothetical protein
VGGVKHYEGEGWDECVRNMHRHYLHMPKHIIAIFKTSLRGSKSDQI